MLDISVLLLCLVLLVALPVVVGIRLTRERLERWVSTELFARQPSPDRLRVDAGYREPLLTEELEARQHDVEPPAEALRATKLLGWSVMLSALTFLPTLRGALLEADAGILGPLASLGAPLFVLGVLQLRARRALTRVQLQRAPAVRRAGWAAYAYVGLAGSCITLATYGALPADWSWVGFDSLGVPIAAVLAFLLIVARSTVSAATAMANATAPKQRIEIETTPLYDARITLEADELAASSRAQGPGPSDATQRRLR